MQEKFNNSAVRKTWRKAFRDRFKKATLDDLAVIRQFVLLLEPDTATRSLRMEAVLDEIGKLEANVPLKGSNKAHTTHRTEEGYQYRRLSNGQE